jgi:ribosomal protein L11 methyltransferase
MPLTEIKAEIPAATADAIEEALLEQGVDGWSLREDALARRAWLLGIFATEAEATAQWSALARRLPPGACGPPEIRPLPESDWRDSYREHFKAWQFGRLHWVPVWERPRFRLPPGDAVLWLDPGLAFGTGNHETTRLCVERLVALAERRPRLSVVDAGCGSGILALSAVLLGAGDVTGFDLDPEAVRVSQENAELNTLDGRVPFFVADLGPGLAGRQADVVLANIQADVLMAHAAELVAAVAPGGALVLSGILATEGAAVRRHFEAVAPHWGSDARTMGEWCDLALVRPDRS